MLKELSRYENSKCSDSLIGLFVTSLPLDSVVLLTDFPPICRLVSITCPIFPLPFFIEDGRNEVIPSLVPKNILPELSCMHTPAGYSRAVRPLPLTKLRNRFLFLWYCQMPMEVLHQISPSLSVTMPLIILSCSCSESGNDETFLLCLL